MRAVVLASGRGSNFEAVLRAIEDRLIRNLSIDRLITDRLHTGAAQLAERQGLPLLELDYKSFSGPDAFHEALKNEVLATKPDLVLALGFMRVLKADLLNYFPQRIINIHPALLPAFPGMNAQKQAINYGARITGCTVHFIDAGIDTGPIILQEAIAVESGWTADDLSRALLPVEHRLLVQAIALFTQGRLRVQGRRVEILSARGAGSNNDTD